MYYIFLEMCVQCRSMAYDTVDKPFRIFFPYKLNYSVSFMYILVGMAMVKGVFNKLFDTNLIYTSEK